MKSIRLNRSVALAGLVVAAMGAALHAPTAASAQVPNPPLGQFAGGLHLNPSSGNGSELPTFSADHACPSGSSQAEVDAIDTTGNPIPFSNPVTSGITIPGGVTGPFIGAMNLAPIVAGTGSTPDSFEFVVQCIVTVGTLGTYTDFVQVNFAADGSWSIPGNVTQTSTSLSATPTSVQVGGNVTLNASVTPTNAAGSVAFKDGSTTLGTVAVSAGAAQFSTTSLAAGAHSLTAVFTPTDATAFGSSTSQPVTVTITSSLVQSETINVNVPASEGVFTMTVDQASTSLGTAVLDSSNTFFSASGSLGTVTVSDGRNQSKPGWHITGQVGSFSDGTHTLDGNSLGWTPKITTPNAANDVVAGPAVPAQSSPGLAQGSGLASAAAAKGLGTTVLGADLSLKVPSSTAAGAYSATLTITAVPSA